MAAAASRRSVPLSPERAKLPQGIRHIALWTSSTTASFACGGMGTDVVDHVGYAVWGGSLVNALFVAPDVRAIFNHRSRVLTDLFPAKSRC